MAKSLGAFLSQSRSLVDSPFSAVPEGLVEPPVEERVVAGGGHGEGVAGEEGDVVPLPAVDAVVEVLRDVDDVEGEPADDEDHQDGHQQAAPSPVPRSLCPPPGQALADKSRNVTISIQNQN